MSLKDKPCYPLDNLDRVTDSNDVPYHLGLTFRERLIIALASNPQCFLFHEKGVPYNEWVGFNIANIMSHADAIIKEMENERRI